MKQETKILCYQKAYNFLKNKDYVGNLRYPEQKRNLEFTCNIGDIDVVYNMRLRTDLLTIRGSKTYPGLTDSQLTDIAKDLLKDEEYMYTAYNEMIIFQLSVTIASVPDEEAKKMVNEKTEAFFDFLSNIAEFGTAEPSSQSMAPETMAESPEATVETEEIPQEPSFQEEVVHEPPVQEEYPQEDDDFLNDDLFHGLEEESSVNPSDVFEPVPENNPTPEVEIPSYEDETYEQSQEDSEDLSEKERMLFQLEWIAEKKAENKRKEEMLNEKLVSAKEVEEKAASMMEEAKEKTEYWLNVKNEYEEKSQVILEKAKYIEEKDETLKRLENELSNRESENQKISVSLDAQKKEIDEKMNALSEKEKNLKNESRSMELIGKQLKEEQEEMKKNQKEVSERISKFENENQSLKDRCKVLQQEIQDKNANILELTENNSKLKEEVELQAAQKWEEKQKAQEERINQLESEKQKVVQELNVRKVESKELIEKISSLEDISDEAEIKMQEKEKLIKKLQKEIELYKQEGTELGVPDEVLQDFAETRKKNRQLERELNDVKEEYEALVQNHAAELQKLQESVHTEKEEFLKEKESSSPKNKALYYQKDLISSGIKLNIEENNDEVCLKGNREGCSIFININKNIIIVSKEIPRANRFTQKIQEWNESELTETYYCDRKSITCKKSLVDLTIDLNKLLQKFVMLK